MALASDAPTTELALMVVQTVLLYLISEQAQLEII
jgi:hypothetical protein